jgi:hypothetical protein
MHITTAVIYNDIHITYSFFKLKTLNKHQSEWYY